MLLNSLDRYAEWVSPAFMLIGIVLVLWQHALRQLKIGARARRCGIDLEVARKEIEEESLLRRIMPARSNQNTALPLVLAHGRTLLAFAAGFSLFGWIGRVVVMVLGFMAFSYVNADGNFGSLAKAWVILAVGWAIACKLLIAIGAAAGILVLCVWTADLPIFVVRLWRARRRRPNSDDRALLDRFFRTSVLSWLVAGKQPARQAALISASITTSGGRRGMLGFLDQLATRVRYDSEGSLIATASDRFVRDLEDLDHELFGRFIAKREIWARDRTYGEALEARDVSVFWPESPDVPVELWPSAVIDANDDPLEEGGLLAAKPTISTTKKIAIVAAAITAASLAWFSVYKDEFRFPRIPTAAETVALHADLASLSDDLMIFSSEWQDRDPSLPPISEIVKSDSATRDHDFDTRFSFDIDFQVAFVGRFGARVRSLHDQLADRGVRDATFDRLYSTAGSPRAVRVIAERLRALADRLIANGQPDQQR